MIPVPDSGNPAARGYARASGLPQDDGLIKNRYVARTFIQPGQELRKHGLRLKFNPLPEVVAGKRIVVVDDSIVRGNTTRQIVQMLRDAGASEVHMRISAPPIRHPCHYGIDMSTREEMIAHNRTAAEVAAELGADSLAYLSLAGVYEAIGEPARVALRRVLLGRLPTRWYVRQGRLRERTAARAELTAQSRTRACPPIRGVHAPFEDPDPRVGSRAGVAGCGAREERTTSPRLLRSTAAPSTSSGPATSTRSTPARRTTPAATWSTNVTQRTPMAYEPGKADARPDLAVAAPTVSEDGKTVTVKLRDGVHFSPPVKREITSADLKYAIERGFFRTVNNPYAPAYFGDLVGATPGAKPGAHIAGITTPDAHTVVFKLRRSTGGTLAAALVLPLAAPVPRDYALALDREKVSGYGPKQVATGPYMLSAYKPGDRITLVRNPSWNAKTDFRPAYLDRIEMPQGNNDPTIAARKVLNGTHTVTGDFLLPPTVLKDAVTKHADQLALVDSGGGRWAALNTTVAPFDDVNVRKAVVAAFNRQSVMYALGGKTVGTVASHFLPPGMPGFDQAGGAKGTGVDFLASPTGNAALAASYMKKAGFASGRYDGPAISMVGPVDGNGRAISTLAKAAFEAVGFKVKLQLLSQQVVMTKFCGSPSAEVSVCPNIGWTRDFADGQTFLDPTFSGASIHAGRQRQRLPARRSGRQRRDRPRQDRDRPDRPRRRVGRGRPCDHGAGPGRAARLGQGRHGLVGRCARCRERAARRLGLRFHGSALRLQILCNIGPGRPGRRLWSPVRCPWPG